jgi:hypothetical protein
MIGFVFTLQFRLLRYVGTCVPGSTPRLVMEEECCFWQRYSMPLRSSRVNRMMCRAVSLPSGGGLPGVSGCSAALPHEATATDPEC